MDINYREAIAADAEKIALLHAKSWQENYRGIWQDEFLDNGVIENRLKVWEERLQHPKPNQHILIGESRGEMVGFACGYTQHDEIWGTLLDNLHVAAQFKGQGIGKKLIKAIATWSNSHAPDAKIYLWVLEKNIAARSFYDNLGGINQEIVLVENPDKSFSPCCRYVWPDVRVLMG